MQPEQQFCSNPACPACGQIGKGNIIIHQTSTGRYKCTVCGKTFSERKGTVFYRKRTDERDICLVVTLVGHGCPVQAITAAFGYDERTVRQWEAESGKHCQKVHEQLVEQPRVHKQIQADELRVKLQGVIVWVAMALCAGTRLWLGAEVDTSRKRGLFDRLAARVRRCCAPGPLLLVTDGLKTYINSFYRAFRDPVVNGKVGRNRLKVWEGLVIGQCVKGYVKKGTRYVCQGVSFCRVGYGTFALLGALLCKTQAFSTGVLNTAYIERFNATIRSRLAGFARRTRALFRKPERLKEAVYLMGTLYNFCTPHQSLRLDTLQRTPAMAGGITDHIWTVKELLTYKVPPPQWTPPKKRGRRSKALQTLIERWCAT
jgi:transposase-like protein